jgi:hypothetical protein
MRRLTTASSILVIGLLALAVAAPAAFAQEQAMSDQPIVGAWVVHPFPGDPTQVSLMVFGPGGTIVTTDQGGAPGLGTWTASGDQTFDLTFDQPNAGPDGTFLGITTIRASGEVSEDGQSFTGTWTLELPEALAGMMGVPAGELGPGEVTAERISAEPMGESVGPLPDFSQMAPPSPEASPAG